MQQQIAHIQAIEVVEWKDLEEISQNKLGYIKLKSYICTLIKTHTMKVTIVGTQTQVEVLHQGFDIVIVKHDNGKQQCMKCSEVGLKNRIRPKVFRY